MGDNSNPPTSDDQIAKGLAEIDRISDLFEKVEALVRLTSELLPTSSEVLNEALAVAEAIGDGDEDHGFHAQALAALAPYLPMPERTKVLEQALKDAESVLPGYSTRDCALAAIAPQLPLEKALEVTEGISENSRGDALVAIAPRLSEAEPQWLNRALDIAKGINYDFAHAKALAAIAPLFPEPKRSELLDQVLEKVRGMEIEILATIVPRLSQPKKFKVLGDALEIAYDKDAPDRVQALAMIAPHVPESERFKLLEQAIVVANDIKSDDYRRDWSLEVLAPQLPSLQALEMADSIKDKATRVKVLTTISSKLTGTKRLKVLQQALETARGIDKNRLFRIQALATIIPHLAKTGRSEVLEQALKVAQGIKDDEYNRDRSLALVAPKLPLQQALVIIQSIEEEGSRADAIVAIAPQLSESRPQLLEQALVMAESFKKDEEYKQDKQYVARTLAAIAPQLSESDRSQVWQKALAATKEIWADNIRAEVLNAIAPQLPENPRLLAQALAVVNDTPYDCSQALLAIASRLPATELELLKQVLENTKKLFGGVTDSKAIPAILAEVIPKIPEPQRTHELDQFLEVAEDADNGHSRAKVLVAISPYLQSESELLQRAFKLAREIDRGDCCAEALAAIAPQFPETEQWQVLEQALAAAAKGIYDSASQDTVLTAITSHFPETYLPLLPQLLETTSWLAKEDVARLLTSPAIRFTEALVVQIPSNKQLVALAILTAKETWEEESLLKDCDKTKFLSALVPRLSIGLFPNALRLIREAITEDVYRAEAFSNLVPYLSTEQLAESLKLITQSIKTSHHLTVALENLIPYLSWQDLQEVLRLLEQTSQSSAQQQPADQPESTLITEPILKARILCAVATALAAQISTGLNQQLTLVESEQVLTPTLTANLEHSLLVDSVLTLINDLKTNQQEGFSYEREATAILNALAPSLINSSEQRQTVVDLIAQFQDLGYQAQVLSKLVSHCQEIPEHFLETCQGNDCYAYFNIKVRAAFIDRLYTQASKEIDSQRREELIKTIQQSLEQLKTTLEMIQGQYRKAEALLEVARYPVGAGYQTRALQAIRDLTNIYLKVQYLQLLIPGLTESQRLESASIIREIPDDYYKVKALVAIACKFPEFRSEAKNEAIKLGKIVSKSSDQSSDDKKLELRKRRVQQIEQLSILALEMPEILPDIIKLVEPEKQPTQLPRKTFGIASGPSDRHQILVALAPHLPMRINREVNRERSAGWLVDDDLWKRALYLLGKGYRDALKGGSLRNETAQNKDSLNLKDEVNALADLLLMRDLEPPMAVGILGGWGGGKSYIMHLMQTHMTQIRSRPISEAEAWNSGTNSEKLSPYVGHTYVGHIYQIKFDAWTFAKSDLWASLMQTIFFELNRQITIEQELQAFFEKNKIDPYEANSSYAEIWQVLYKASEGDREYFLQKALKIENLEELKQNKDVDRLNKAENLLWGKLGETKEQLLKELKQKRNKLETTETTILEKRNQLKEKKQALERNSQKHQQEIAQQLQKVPENTLKEVIQTTLGVSGVVLRNRLGPKAFEDLQGKIIQQLPEKIDINNLTSFETKVREAVTRVVEDDAEGSPFHFSWQAIRQWGRKNSSFLVIFGLFALASVVAPILVSKVNPSALVPQIVALITPLLPAIAMAQKLWRSAQKWNEQARQALHEYEQQIQANSQHYVEDKMQKWREKEDVQRSQSELDNLEKDLKELESQKQQLQAEIQTVEKDLPENLPSSLADYINNRIQEGSYDKQLGLMHQVKQDLTNLSSRLLPPSVDSVTTEELKQRIQNLKEVFPRGPARVVVYIDDLDRCPPDRVVQVLEAVQLLVKTPLFIAVLAIDERYITRALEKFYQGVLSRRGRPSGSDYLEKIIQLPYRVRPIMANTLEGYLRSQIVIQDNATGGAKFSEFSRQEFNMLMACCQQVDLSPRTIKRLTNVYKLFKVVCRTRGAKPSLQVQQTILALLAFSGRYPDLMRGIFDVIQTCFEEQRTPQKAAGMAGGNPFEKLHLDSPICNFFNLYELPDSDRYLNRELGKLQHDALETNLLPPKITLNDMTHEIFNLIRSFSFVGEIGEDPQDYRSSGPAEGESSNSQEQPASVSKIIASPKESSI